jgi:hypothetical protein
MDLVNLLSKLQAIEVQEGLSDKQKEIAKQAGDPDKIEGEDFAALRGKKKANEDIENVLRGLMAIQEGDDKCPKCGEVHEGACDKSKVEECGDMEMSPLTAPTAGIDMTPMAAMAPQAEPEMTAEPAEEKPSFTLTIRNGDSNLSMTTDVPDEIMHVMKLAGLKGKAEVKPTAPEQQGEEKAVEEAWGNTPEQTGEKEPAAYGDIRDWARKGTGAGKPNYPGTKASGDNPMNEQKMFEEYKLFKTGK